MTTNNIPCPTDASIILTYRCPMRCKMCNVWQYPTEKSKEIQLLTSQVASLSFVRIWIRLLKNAINIQTVL